MPLEHNQKTERVMTPDEVNESIRRMRSIPEKLKLLEDQMRAIDTKGAGNTNSGEHEKLGALYVQFETMKKSLAEEFSAARTVEQSPADHIPTITGDEDADEALRATVSGPAQMNEVDQSTSGPNRAAVMARPEAAPKTAEAAAPVPFAPSVEQTARNEAAEPSNEFASRAKSIAQKIKTELKGMGSLNDDEMNFKNEHWDLVERELMAIPSREPMLQVMESSQTVEAKRTAYLDALDSLEKSRAFKTATESDERRMEEIKHDYNESVRAKMNEAFSEGTNLAAIRFLRTESVELNEERIKRQDAETAARTRKAMARLAGRGADVFAVVGMSLIGGGEIAYRKIKDVVKKGSEKMKPALEKLRQAVKDAANQPKYVSSKIDLFGEIGKRSFEQAPGKASPVASTESEKDSKAKDESKKTETGSQEKKDVQTPEQIAKIFRDKAMASEYGGGKNMTKKEWSEANTAWKNIKDEPLIKLMEPDKADWGPDADGAKRTYTADDLPKSMQGLRKKLLKFYEANKPLPDDETVESFISQGLKSGDLN